MTRETNTTRIALLEQRADERDEQLAAIAGKVNAIHDLLMQAKGARWAVIAMASASGFVAGLVTKLTPFLPALPR